MLLKEGLKVPVYLISLQKQQPYMLEEVVTSGKNQEAAANKSHLNQFFLEKSIYTSKDQKFLSWYLVSTSHEMCTELLKNLQYLKKFGPMFRHKDRRYQQGIKFFIEVGVL